MKFFWKVIQLKKTHMSRKTENDPEESSTTDDEEQEHSTQTIKLLNETWSDRPLALQLKGWLKENLDLQNKSYISEYIPKFLEVAQLASRFKENEDQDRAFDEVMNVFSEWPKNILTRELPEYSNQTLIQTLTDMGIPYWGSRILYKSARSEILLNPSKEFQGERKFLLQHKDNLGNTFAHSLAKFVNVNYSEGLYMIILAATDPLWFGTITKEFADSFEIPNKIGVKASDIFNDKSVMLDLQNSVFQPKRDQGSTQVLKMINKEKVKSKPLLDKELGKEVDQLRDTQRFRTYVI